MGEHRSYTGSFNYYPTHGGSSRNARPIPRSFDWKYRSEQGHRDKQALVHKILQRHEDDGQVERCLGNKNLPAFAYKQTITDAIETYKAVVIGGETGSGKSTQTPQFSLELGVAKVFHMVPRRIIADGLYERLIDELSETLGEEQARATVGVVHGERADFSEDNRIIVMTPQTFVRMEASLRERYGNDAVVILSDEIHEANIQSEIATGVAAQAVSEKDTWRLALLSATHNKQSLNSIVSRLNGGPVVEVEIEGRPFDIRNEEAPDETPMEVYARLQHDHQKAMIFTSGKKEIQHVIEETRRVLDAQVAGSSHNVVFRKLHAELTDYELSHINDPVPDGKRLVIVSSPAGMSGITISGVSLVVADGTINRQELDEETATGLTRCYSSQAEITQMFGRAGRDIGGGVGVLAKPIAVEEDKMRARHQDIEVEQMPFQPFAERDEFGPPEIYHTNLSGVVLSVAALDRSFAEVNEFIPHSVKELSIVKANESLARLGALDDDDSITDTGRMMSPFPVRPELSRGLAEALQQKRSLQHMARMAVITAAMESGGVQEFLKGSGDEWKKLLRPRTNDDAITQLDIMMNYPHLLEKHADSSETGREQLEFIRSYDLSYKRTKRTQKVIQKILKEVGIQQPNLHLELSTIDEEQQLRDDLAAGMIDLVYTKADVRHRRQLYRNIHGDKQSKSRFISDRSVVSPTANDYIAGMPRWFETNKRDGTRERHDVVELLFPVNPQTIGRYALQNQLLTKQPLESVFRDGEVIGRHQPMFGAIPVGGVADGHAYTSSLESDRKLLTQKVFESKPGYALEALLDLAEELESYQRRLPKEDFIALKRHDAPALFTKKRIEELVYGATKNTLRAVDVEGQLQQYIYEKNIGIDRYFSTEALEEIWRRTPNELLVNDRPLRIFYDHGSAYVTLPTDDETREALLETPHYLPDGREILVQLPKQTGGSERVSVAS